MLLQLTFALMLLLSCGYAAIAGGIPGRACAALFMTAAFASMLPARYFNWQSTFHAVFGIDLICFLCLAILAMNYNRGWLIWCAGLQLAGLATHLATIIAPGFTPMVYQALAEFWSIPILVLMVTGIMQDRRAAA